MECFPSPPDKVHFLKAHTANKQQHLDRDLGERTGEVIFCVSILTFKRERIDAIMSIMPQCRDCSEASKTFQKSILEALVFRYTFCIGLCEC